MIAARIVIAAQLCAFAVAHGQAADVPANARPIAHSFHRSGPIQIDGRLSEPAWAAAVPITEFIQQDPVEGQPATQRTEIRILYDDDALYVGARMFDSLGARGVSVALTRRDELLSMSGVTSDKIAIEFDTFRNKNDHVWFELNPLGVKGDEQNGDASYDPVWEGASTIDSLGWTAEFRIPLSQLRFTSDTTQSWGLQILRTVDRRKELDMWAFWKKSDYGGPARFGSLDGIVVRPAARNVELVPYMTSRATFKRAALGDPFHRNAEARNRIGADAKLSLSSSLTMSITANPDFGQVEVDPAVVNLSALETTFDEKRPFFTADGQYFQMTPFNCIFCMDAYPLTPLYSRRIGRSPQMASGLGSRADYLDVPDATTILGAVKLTGQAKGTTIGVLNALTNRESARFMRAGNPADSSQEVEPLSNYFVSRLRKDLRGGDTRIGALGTLVSRRLTTADERAGLGTHAAVIGADLDHRWQDRNYSFVTQFALSDVAGDTAMIRDLQQSSARYFQRPDRTERSDGLFDTSYDPQRRSLRGYALYSRLAKDAGNWLWELSQNWTSPGFEANDLGILQRGDSKWMNATLARMWMDPTSWYRSLMLTAETEREYNFQGDMTDYMYHGLFSIVLPNYWSVNALTMYEPALLDATLTRGGPIAVRNGYNYGSISVNTDRRRPLVGSFSYSITQPQGSPDGWAHSINTTLTMKPSPRFVASLTPSYSHRFGAQQYVRAVSDPNAPAGFGGQRYVFAVVDQRTLSAPVRVNATFSPGLTLELYAQPFIASGAYQNFKEFVEPRSRTMFTYGKDNGSTLQANPDPITNRVTSYSIDPDGAGPSQPFTVANPNFNIRSVRGTGVVRWEYRPGSTIFFVWSQERQGFDDLGRFDLQGDFRSLFGDRPTNIFQIKATYWIGR